MGTAITNILQTKEVTIADLQHKVLAVDAFNMLYQFLSSIRQADGSPLTDSKGRVTSHLIGLFSRITKLMREDIRFVFVFDGKTPDLKNAERQRRKELKADAGKKYEAAKKEEDIELMKKYASRTSVLNKDMISEAKKLIEALGMPIVQAPSEGEAQAAYMAKKGDCYGIVSQDTDSLIFGAPRVVKNLTLSGKRKTANKLVYKKINPEIISLEDNLNHLGLTQNQMIALAILVGTDYNIGGVKGIGPKKALNLLKMHGESFEKIFEEAGWEENFEFGWKEIFDLIKDIPVTDEYNLSWDIPDREKIMELLVEEHDFGRERVERTIEKLLKGKPAKTQKGLGEFF